MPNICCTDQISPKILTCIFVKTDKNMFTKYLFFFKHFMYVYFI